MINIEYNRRAAVDYANRWALSRNPAFYDYTGIGGDCTNFASQVVYAGCGVMNYTPDTGWYYIDANNKSPSWTGVQFFYDFMINRSKTDDKRFLLMSKDKYILDFFKTKDDISMEERYLFKYARKNI